jgi:hypothetical protein
MRDDDVIAIGNTISPMILTPMQYLNLGDITPPQSVTFQGAPVTWQGDPDVTWKG